MVTRLQSKHKVNRTNGHQEKFCGVVICRVTKLLGVLAEVVAQANQRFDGTMDVNGSKPIGRLEIHEQGKPTCKRGSSSPGISNTATEVGVGERFIHLSKEILLGRGNGYT